MKEAKFRNFGCRIRDGITYKGIRAVFLENNLLKVGILVDKGTDIFEFLYKPMDMDFVWLSPFGVRSPKDFMMTKNQVGGRFMDFYEGGWQEIFPNGGDPCEIRGAEFGQHDEISLLPWSYEIIEDSKDSIEVKFWVNTRLTPFCLEKSLRLENNNPVLMVKEKVINKSSVDLEAIWGHHLAYGHPFLTEGCKINISAKKGLTYDIDGVLDENIKLGREFSWPILPTKNGDKVNLSVIPSEGVATSKFLYLSELEKAEYEIVNEKINLKIKVDWDKKVMPYVWYWQEFNKTGSYPWYKMSRVFGLEPFSTDVMGLDGTIKKSKALIINGNSELDYYINLAVLKM